MTKKHFIELADELRPVLRGLRKADRGELIDALVRFCVRQNPRFLSSRWIDYLNEKCGPNGGAIKSKAPASG